MAARAEGELMGWPTCEVRGCRRQAFVRFSTEHHKYLLCQPCFKTISEGGALEIITTITIKEVRSIAKLVEQGG